MDKKFVVGGVYNASGDIFVVTDVHDDKLTFIWLCPARRHTSVRSGAIGFCRVSDINCYVRIC